MKKKLKNNMYLFKTGQIISENHYIFESFPKLRNSVKSKNDFFMALIKLIKKYETMQLKCFSRKNVLYGLN